MQRSVFTESLLLPSYRLATDRPVMTREQLVSIGKRILGMATVDTVNVSVVHMAQVVTRMAAGRVLSSDDGNTLRIQIETMQGGPPAFYVSTNQLDDTMLSKSVQQCEALLRANPGYQADSGMKHELPAQDEPVPVQLWHESTVDAMTTARGTVIPQILESVRREQLQAAGFLGLIARAEAVIRKDGNIIFFHDETDCEITVTARSLNGKSVGWAGQTTRDWSAINIADITRRAIETAKRGINPVAVEPGRRTAILTPAAVAQLLRFFAAQWSGFETNRGQTALSKTPHGGNRVGERIMDSRLTMTSNPADPAGGYRPYIWREGVATPQMTWVDHGILTNLAYNVADAMERGKQYAAVPHSLRLSGGTTPVEQMIAQCREGILVNRFADVELVEEQTCMLTGVTSGGCFLIKDGKIKSGVKDFRFLESPFFILNRIEALGVPERAVYGNTPLADSERGWPWEPNGIVAWPRQPMIVPSMMVRDFNFRALADAV